MDPHLDTHVVLGVEIAVARWGRASGRNVVMLHEGLGSITQWRDLPERIHAVSGATVTAYDRAGYGRSRWGATRYEADFMHREAEALPHLLTSLGIDDPVLFGHSDGASIALIAAGSALVAPAAIAVVAPHVSVEQVCLDGIDAITQQRDEVVERLARHHRTPGEVFDRWSGIWLDESFRDWDITSVLRAIDAPVVALQGEDDEYATNEMIDTIVALTPRATGRFVPDCGHVAHRDQPEATLQLAIDALRLAEGAAR